MKKGMRDNRIEQRLQREIENLYGNEELTADLDDSSAKMFLDWAESHVRKIVDGTADLEDNAAEEVMYPRLKAMRRMARYVNQAISGQGDLFELGQKIIEQARELYGESFIEPDQYQVQALMTVPRVEPEVFIQLLKNLLEGATDGEED